MSGSFDQTILLTGATGFIGRYLLDRLRRIPNARLVCLSRNLPRNLREGETWVTTALDQLVPETWHHQGVHAIDVVYHLGAFTPKTSSGGDMVDEIYRSNLLGTRALLESLPCVPKKVILASTLDVYAPTSNEQLLTESSPLSPSTLYGASKLFCEHLVQAFARQHGCGYAILRYGHIYGPGEGSYSKLIPVAIQALLRNESPTIYGDGSSERDFLFVEDAVEATARAANIEVEKIDPVNIVSGKSKSVREIVEILTTLCAYRQQAKYLLDKPAGRSFRFCNNRMAELFGSWEMVPLQVGLGLEVEYFKGLRERDYGVAE
jgi:nucleoside-diphosphate-sugar epimerase